MKQGKGFTLVELMLTLAIVAIIFKIVVPSFQQLFLQHQVQAESQKWFSAFHLARQTAISQGHIVTLCPSKNGKQCGKSWQQGAIIFVDENRNHLRDDTEQVTQHIAPAIAKFHLSWRAFQNRNYVQFQQNGFTWHQNGTLRLCVNSGVSEFNRALIVTRTGRVRLSRDNDGDGYHEDAKGEQITCK
ncbi:GspH/FimT family pseudopilin [Thalassotalea aquiviva]|uniref:GspH/FimT family pseudopilin n=1 Tax=Thalassotalea aquiviva TaxID=3242415 RepID=UPI00352B7AAF